MPIPESILKASLENYIIFKVGGQAPTVFHQYRWQAEAEVKRLAALEPSSTFFVATLVTHVPPQRQLVCFTLTKDEFNSLPSDIKQRLTTNAPIR